MENGSEVIIKLNSVFSDQVSLCLEKTEIGREKVAAVKGRQFISNKRYKEAVAITKAWAHARFNGFKKQEDSYFGELQNLVLLDEAEEVVEIARSENIKAKLFAITTRGGHHPLIQEKNFDWDVKPLQMFNDLIPLETLEAATVFKEKGIDFDGWAIAKPKRKPLPPDLNFKRLSTYYTDPVLLGWKKGARGHYFWIEIGRWD